MTDLKNIAQLARKRLYSNLLAKLNAGKTLTANERSTFDELNAAFDTDGTQGARGGVLLETQQLEALFRVTRETISQWTKAGMPKASYGKYDLFAVMGWWHENVNARDEEKDRWLSAYRREQAKKARLERLRLEGNLVDADEALLILGEEITSAKNAFRGIGRKLALRLVGREPAEIEGEICDEIDQILNRLATRRDKKGKKRAK